MNAASAVPIFGLESALKAIEARRIARNLSMNELDEAVGQAPGTASKYLGPSRIKGLGVTMLVNLAAGVGLRVVLEIDEAASAKLADESRTRHGNQARPGNFAQQVSKRVKRRVAVANARKAVKARKVKIAPALRSAIARHAAMRRHYPNRVYDWDAIKKAAARSQEAVG